MIGESYLPKEKGAVKEIKNIDKNEKENNNKATINIGEKKENKTLSFALNNKLNFNDKKIITIKELSNNRIGILFVHLLSIYSSKTFKKINEIKLDNTLFQNSEKDEENSDNKNEIVIDFIELKNLDLVLWTTKATILFYNLNDSNYTLSQTIKENIQKEEKKEEAYFYMERFYSNNKDDYNINSIYQLSNGNIVSCNTNGIKIYSKKNDKYELELNCPMDIEVIDAIEIKINQLILFQANFVSGGFCSQSYHCTLTYSVSLYDIENKKSKCLSEFEENVALRNNKISFFRSNELLFVKFGQFKFDIYDLKQNMKSLNQNNEIIEIDTINEFIGFCRLVNFVRIKDEMNINFLCNYSKDLFFAKDVKNNIKLYQFKNKAFESYQDFPLSKADIRGMIKLKNNNIIMYSFNEIMVVGEC
jgi:hypothetical protein